MTDTTARLVEAERVAEAFALYMDPALDVCRVDYVEKLAEIAAKPMTDANRAALEKLAVAVKVVDQVRGQIRSLMLEGAVAKRDAERAAQVAAMTTEQRKWYNW